MISDVLSGARSWGIEQGDVRRVLAEMPAESVQTVVTSPPYWGLRDYGTGQWAGGDAECDHRGPVLQSNKSTLQDHGADGRSPYLNNQGVPYRDTCGKCGATRIDNQIGLERTPDEYVQTMVDVFRGVRRVLRNDGTLWLNLGDSYHNYRPGAYDDNRAHSFGGPRSDNKKRGMPADPSSSKRGQRVDGLKEKDLCMIPARVALALQADGWWLRSVIIWAKPNPMPESVTDRPTTAHEYIYLLAKSERYFYDADAIREPVAESTIGRGPVDFGGEKGRNYKPEKGDPNYRGGNEQWGRTFDYRESCANGRNKRTVWNVATSPFSGAHFATFPPKLIEPCILAGTSERGCCPECGAPWERVVERDDGNWQERKANGAGRGSLINGHNASHGEGMSHDLIARSVLSAKWQPTCKHAHEPVPCVVLDPFGGAGTTLMVALRHGRRAVGIELSAEYIRMAEGRIVGDAPLFNMIDMEAVS